MKGNILLFVIILLAGYAIIVFGSQSPKVDNQWIYLFDGTSTEGWKAYNGKSLPSKWTIQDSVLTFHTDSKLEKDMNGGGDIIYYFEEFENFELYLEWKLPLARFWEKPNIISCIHLHLIYPKQNQFG